jgi:hypothetical protein
MGILDDISRIWYIMGLELTHTRETYPPSSIMRWDRGIQQLSIWIVMAEFHGESYCCEPWGILRS